MAIHPEMRPLLAGSGLASLTLGGRELLPLVQGGMGVGVSAHRLAGSVAALGGVGTISSVDLRRHHPDLMERTRGIGFGDSAKALIDAANDAGGKDNISVILVRAAGGASAPARSWWPFRRS